MNENFRQQEEKFDKHFFPQNKKVLPHENHLSSSPNYLGGYEDLKKGQEIEGEAFSHQGFEEKAKIEDQEEAEIFQDHKASNKEGDINFKKKAKSLCLEIKEKTTRVIEQFEFTSQNRCLGEIKSFKKKMVMNMNKILMMPLHLPLRKSLSSEDHQISEEVTELRRTCESDKYCKQKYDESRIKEIEPPYMEESDFDQFDDFDLSDKEYESQDDEDNVDSELFKFSLPVGRNGEHSNPLQLKRETYFNNLSFQEDQDEFS